MLRVKLDVSVARITVALVYLYQYFLEAALDELLLYGFGKLSTALQYWST